ncbi:transcription factor [Spathaspora passalidarum NRRL Y-27907]|uniref:Transcription factor n=1 Tax=Spathaspora passalidarum (strain NRRL Y-27907 / 11-Y1) TaxID=619300 RepID=G3AFX5_SPAPN|nr:transcription factor [Spathaspora passalidarum NRRL Y-27907]EGW35114.1 transcription factor [Spathaspora passalidarum NRRL Y-27907]
MSEPRKLAEKHSMDIPHVTSIELPLNVKNPDRAIAMLGGKDRIATAINAQSNPNRFNLALENTLELRLRNDPFHHPIQSSIGTQERVLLKMSIPKKSLPPDFHDNPSKYPIRELLERNKQNKETTRANIQPVAIVDRNYSFKSIADFQVSTKNNPIIQEFSSAILNGKNFDTMDKYLQSHKNFVGLDDFKDENYFKNTEHGFIPPPVLSPIRFPFDYRYQKNPLTTAIKDVKSGEIKVVPNRSTMKLYTIMLDYHTGDIPRHPASELQENYKKLTKKKLAVNSPDAVLLECIKWVKRIFKIKPIWLRKQLEDIIPDKFRRTLKQALPYVSYIYKSGPWRFANIKLGVDPKNDPSFWIYQSEYFRIPGLKFTTFMANKTGSQRIVPRTILEANRRAGNIDEANEVEVSESLFFNGVTLPSTVTFQLGDILDLDITTIIEDHVKHMGNDFLREHCDFQDGWLNRQSMEVLRRIVRYKLNRMVKDEPIDQNKIYKIINTDYIVEELGGSAEPEADGDEAGDEEEVEGDDEDIEAEAEAEEEETNGTDTVDERSVMNRLDELTEDASSKLSRLVGFIKQDSIEN